VKLLIIRPEPGASATAARAKAAGFEPILLPMFSIARRAWKASATEHFDALLFTSANAVRHAGDELNSYRALPVHAVGERTAAALHGLAIEPVSIGSDGVDEALAAARRAGHKNIIWLAGEDHTKPLVPDGLTLEIAICYASEALPLTPDTATRIAQADSVALHSIRAAQHFSAIVGQFGIDRSTLTVAAFSPAIAAAAGEGWRAVAIAAQPTDRALLSALDEVARQQSIATANKDSR
jgi:uroporphyrinogen-III synthase